MKPVLRISWQEYADLEQHQGAKCRWVNIAGKKESTLFNGLELTEVVVVPWPMSDKHIEKYGEPIKIYEEE